nr:MAG TPA: hypothetical protein [Caudoviricetes sp.]
METLLSPFFFTIICFNIGITIYIMQLQLILKRRKRK